MVPVGSRLLLSFLTLLPSALQGRESAAQGLETSPNYEAVDAHLSRGGMMYGYVDVEGDVERLAGQLSGFFEMLRVAVPEMEMVPSIPIREIVDATGLGAIEAIGISSSKVGSGFHNRTFLLMPEGPQGLLRLGGTSSERFGFMDLAPGGSDLVFEQEVNGAALVDFARTIAQHAQVVAGPHAEAMVEGYLHHPLGPTSVTALEVIEGVTGRMMLVADIDPSGSMSLPGGLETQQVNVFLRVENAAPLLDHLVYFLGATDPEAIESLEKDRWTMVKGFKAPPFADPLVAADQATGELIFASSADYMDRCLEQTGARISEDGPFVQATRGLPATGTSFTYLTPDVSEYILSLVRAAAAEEEDPEAEVAAFWITGGLSFSEPMASVTAIEEDGILVVSNWNHSHKRNLSNIASVNPLTVGLFAAMAIPAFNKVRETSQEKAILNNLRMLDSAAEQYFLETGRSQVDVSELIGPGRYIRQLEPLAGESYPEILTDDRTEITATLPDGREVTLSR